LGLGITQRSAAASLGGQDFVGLLLAISHVLTSLVNDPLSPLPAESGR
jgi:hypothetical protein